MILALLMVISARIPKPLSRTFGGCAGPFLGGLNVDRDFVGAAIEGSSSSSRRSDFNPLSKSPRRSNQNAAASLLFHYSEIMIDSEGTNPRMSGSVSVSTYVHSLPNVARYSNVFSIFESCDFPFCLQRIIRQTALPSKRSPGDRPVSSTSSWLRILHGLRREYIQSGTSRC